MPERASLLNRMLGSANDVLRLGLNPEVLRIIRQVGKNRNKRPPRKRLLVTLPQRAIKMRDKRHHHVRRVLLPELFEYLHRGPVVGSNDNLQHAHELRAAQGPAVPQHLVVHVLNANSGQFAKDIQGIKHFLKVYQGHVQRQAKLLDLHLQRGSGVAVASACVKENKMDAASAVLRAGHSVCHLPLHPLVR